MSRKPILDQPTIDRALGRQPKLTEADVQQTCVIPLSRAMVAIVDAVDYPRLSQRKWYALKVGKKNGHQKFYAARTDYRSRKCILMHRDILGLIGKAQCDHRDANATLDNRRINLRIATNAENSRNSRKRPGPCTSRFKGVSFRADIGKWEAGVRGNGYSKRLCFVDECDAALAYNLMALEAFGEFARMNEA